MKILYNYFFDGIFKLYKLLTMADNPFSRKVIADLDKTLEGRKPIETIKDDIQELKVDIMHIKNYIRKLEIREQIKEEEESQPSDKYEILDNNREPKKSETNGWFW
jgi:hypothetical protein